MKFLLLPALLLATANVSAAMYKCKGPDGKIQYQQTLCPAATEQNMIKPPPNPGKADVETAKARAEEATEYIRLKAAEREKRIVSGMTEDQVIAIVGQPRKINHGIYHDGTKHEQQWIYPEDRHNASYVYFTNGTVTSIQFSEYRR